MTGRLLKVLPLGVFGALIAVLTAGVSPAQEPIPLPLPQPGAPAQPAQPGAGIDVLAKGPVHEAFATTAEAPAATTVVRQEPPEPIEELPPDQKPAGDNVQWIPGYWHWDDEAGKFIWVSGFWRQVPPGRVWVPGSWRAANGGSQWVPGFWQEVNPQPLPNQPQQPVQPEIEYLPEPPATVEVGPTVAAPGAGYFYVPGSWVWRGRYVWRPGVWVEYRESWVWVPARYSWTPAGWVFCEGYWDYPLDTRGVLFAPVAFTQPLYTEPAFVYTPTYVVSEPCMVGALFVRRGCSNYFFGDYFGAGYVNRGYSAWCGTFGHGGFSIGFGVGRSWGYDPLWSYYSVAHRGNPGWHRGVGDLYGGRYRGDLVRPPTTLVQQNTVINKMTNVNVTNVTNNITVVNGQPRVNNRDVSQVAMVAPLRVAPDLQRTKFQAVNAEARRNEAATARQLREVAVQRSRLETAAAKQQPLGGVNRPQIGGRPAPAVQPQSIKLDVPKAVVARARIGDETKGPPPHPLRATNRPGAGIGSPRIESPRVEPKQPGIPRFDPQQPVNPRVEPPRNNPLPRIEPKQPRNPQPKVEPPRIDPKPFNPAPRIEPKQPANPAPKVEQPRLPVNPQPRVEAPRQPFNPLPKGTPRIEPKAEAPRPQPNVPRINPQPAPKAEPPRVNPQPAPRPVNPQPKVELPRPPLNPQPAPRIGPSKQPVNPQPAPRQPANPPRINPPQNLPRPVQQPRAVPRPQPQPQPQPRPAPVQPRQAAPPVQQPRVNPRPPANPPQRVQPQARPQPPAPKARPQSPPVGKPGRGKGKG